MNKQVYYTAHRGLEQIGEGTCQASQKYPSPAGLIRYILNREWPRWTYGSWATGDQAGVIWRRRVGPGVVALAIQERTNDEQRWRTIPK